MINQLFGTSTDDPEETVLNLLSDRYNDIFPETHSALATYFYNALKTERIYRSYTLPFDASVMGTFYNSRSECAAAKKATLQKAYNAASTYVTPDHSKCIARYAAEYYGAYIRTCFPPQVIDSLEKLYDRCDQADGFRMLREKILRSTKNLRRLFENELTDNKDYYAMYRFQYFMDQVDIEEHDYRVMEGGFLRSLEKLMNGSIQYTMSDIHEPVSEMENDLADHTNAFFKAAHSEYQYYCMELAELLQPLGDSFRPKTDEESVLDYLNDLSSGDIK